MSAKKHLKMKGVKHSSKRLEDELVDHSRALANNPDLLRPQCIGNCKKCAFEKIFKMIYVIQKMRNDPDALMKEASKFGRDEIARAYAGTISLAAVGSIPLLATTNFGDGRISYAIRGNSGSDKLIGCQYYDDPGLRMLLYKNFIKKNKLYMYSSGNDIFCSNIPNMPEKYLNDALYETGYKLNSELSCGHETSAILEIYIKSIRKKIQICDECAIDVSTVKFIVSHMITIDPVDDIVVNIRHKYHTKEDDDLEDITGDLLNRYVSGAVTDESLISLIIKSKVSNLKDNNVPIYIIGRNNYGSSLNDFIDSLSGGKREIETLRKFLSENARTIILKSERVSEAMTVIWENDWKPLVSIHTSKKVANLMGDLSKNPPMQQLADAYDLFISIDVIATLPTFKKPGPITQMIDRLSRSAKIGGSDMIIKTAQAIGIKNSMSRSIYATFLMATGREDMPIKLTNYETDLARYLVPFVKSVINTKGEAYRDAMNTLLTACSSGEKV